MPTSMETTGTMWWAPTSPIRTFTSSAIFFGGNQMGQPSIRPAYHLVYPESGLAYGRSDINIVPSELPTELPIKTMPFTPVNPGLNRRVR